MSFNTDSCTFTYLLHGAESFLRSKSVLNRSRNSPHFMKPQGSWATSIQSMPPSHFLKLNFNIIFPSTPASSKWSLSFRLPYQNPVYTSPLPRTCCMPRPSHTSRFGHPNNIERGVQIIKVLIMSLSPLTCYFLPLRSKYPPQHPIPKHP